MQHLSITPYLKRRFTQAVRSQPERFVFGTNYAGGIYIMSDRHKRQQVRVLRALKEPDCQLSRADLAYLYAVVYQAESHSHPYYVGNETRYPTMDMKSPYWKKVKAAFQEAGLSSIPSLTVAWDMH